MLLAIVWFLRLIMLLLHALLGSEDFGLQIEAPMLLVDFKEVIVFLQCTTSVSCMQSCPFMLARTLQPSTPRLHDERSFAEHMQMPGLLLQLRMHTTSTCRVALPQRGPVGLCILKSNKRAYAYFICLNGRMSLPQLEQTVLRRCACESAPSSWLHLWQRKPLMLLVHVSWPWAISSQIS